MANLDRPCGFRPYGKVLHMSSYVAGANVFPGDAVQMQSDGKVDPVVAGSTILGVALSYATDGNRVLVCDDPEQKYIGQGDETQLDAQTVIGNNCDILATAGNTTYNMSRMEIDSSTFGTSSAQVTILDILQRSNNAGGANCDVVFKINEHQLKDAFAGV